MARPTQTHCKRGHALSGNVYEQRQGGYVNRRCKTCMARVHSPRSVERRRRARMSR